MLYLKQEHFLSIFLFFLIILVTTTLANARYLTTQKGSKNNSFIPSIIIFGDSTVDSGNNNYIKTLFKANFPPYGVDFSDHTPTGRFTDGKLATDYIASYVGVKETIPAYLDPSLSLEDLITGVSFASAGSGYDPLTAAKTSVMDLSKQLEYFDEYKNKLQQRIGKKKTSNIVRNAVYVISSGTNDIIYTLIGTVESSWTTFTVPPYLEFLLNQLKWFLQALKERGARKVAVVGLPPVGCLPAVITVRSSVHDEQRRCVDIISSIAREFNQMLQTELKTIQASQPNFMVRYLDIYGPLDDQVNHPQKYGFEEVDKGCCGSGSIEAGIACSSLSPICKDRSKYLFWDAIHPTQRSYYFLFQAIRPVVDSYLHQ